MNFEITANKIIAIRKRNGLTQDDFAKKLNVSRPTVSNWEQGKCAPTTEQILRINEIFHVSADEILQSQRKTSIVVDTCVLMKMPRILNRLLGTEKINNVIIPDVVVSELNYQKDHGSKQLAWLAMASIERTRKEYPSRLTILNKVNSIGINDQKIISIATQFAQDNRNHMVYLLTDDIFFTLAANTTSNFRILPLRELEDIFPINEGNFCHESSALFFAEVKADNINGAKRDYNKSVNPNFMDPETGYTPLIQAVRNRSYSMVDFLMNLPGTNGSLCDEAKYRLPAISHAVQLNEFKLVKLLTENGADIDCQSQGKNHGNTPLMIAAWHGKDDFVQYLIQQGACVNQQDSNGFTALIKACIKNNVSCTRMLYKITDCKIRSIDGLTAKDYAQKTNNQELINIFNQEKN